MVAIRVSPLKRLAGLRIRGCHSVWRRNNSDANDAAEQGRGRWGPAGFGIDAHASIAAMLLPHIKPKVVA
jgi:hypothetical protein